MNLGMRFGVGVLLLLPCALMGQDSAQLSPAPLGAREVQPNPNSSGIYHVGGGVSAPTLTWSVDPEFSDKARKKKLHGKCVVFGCRRYEWDSAECPHR
jgi:hypothetical protein